MCELFAMSSCKPATVQYTLAEFQRHGGIHHNNGDGWGCAFYDGGDARILRDTCAARESSYFDFIRSHNHPSHCVISHIRQATVGSVKLRNTQPFARELWGKLNGEYLFAHSHRRTQADGVKRPPGLYLLQREDHHHDHDHQQVHGLRIHTPELIPYMSLVASVPLTVEDWQPLAAGTLAVLRKGKLLYLGGDVHHARPHSEFPV